MLTFTFRNYLNFLWKKLFLRFISTNIQQIKNTQQINFQLKKLNFKIFNPNNLMLCFVNFFQLTKIKKSTNLI